MASPTSFIDPNNPLGIGSTYTNPYQNLFKPQVTADPNNPTTQPPNITASDPLQNLADLSTVIGSAGSGLKADRALQGQFTQNYDRLMLEAQQDRRAQEADAMKKLQQTAYLTGGGSKFTPGTFNIGGKDYTMQTYGLEPPKPTAEEIQGAGTLQQQMLSRLQPSGSYSPTDVNKYAKPGTMERITDIAAPVAGGIGFIDKMTGGKISGGLGHLLGKIPGLGGSSAGASAADAGTGSAADVGGAGSFILGKALPIAGIGLGGYELYKNKGLGSDILGGASAGAGTGTLIAPGIGTAIGAGIGAGVGALRHAFGGPDAAEKEGRAAGGQVFDALAAQATPDQMKQAQAAGWDNPQEAAAYIVMGDRLRAMGLNPALADQYMKQIYDAQKHGGQAVASAVSPIDAMLSGRG